MKTNIEDSYKAEFSERLRDAFEDWKYKQEDIEDRHINATDLAVKVNEIAGSKLNRQQIWNYLNGKNIPKEKTLDALCKVLECDLRPRGGNDRYSYNSKYQRSFLREIRKTADKKNLLPFLRWIESMPGFDDLFPLYLPIRCVAKANGFDIEYVAERSVPAAAAKASSDGEYTKDNALFQVKKAGQCYDLSVSDLEFLADMRSYLEDCAKDFMQRRIKEMSDEVKIANEKMNIQQNGITYTCDLSNEDLRKIEKYRP